MNTLALYYRASNEDGNGGESATIANQRDLLNHYIKSRPEFADWNVMEFQDDGWSGTTLARPGVQKMLQMAGVGIQCIIVKDFSRFGRNLIEVGDYLDQVFPFLGVRFIAVNEHFDSKNSKGRTVGLDVSLKAMVYEMYSQDLSKKISSVKEAQMKRGRYAGSWSFYGYQKTETSTSGLTIDLEAAQVVQRIFSLACDGIRPVQIAVLLNSEGILPPLSYRQKQYPKEAFPCGKVTGHNVWTQKGVSAILRDERYTGCLISKKRMRTDLSTKKIKQLDKDKWLRVENALEEIVSREIFEKAQGVSLQRREKRSQIPSNELFRGLLKCEHCGRTMEKILCKEPYFRCPAGKYVPDSPCAHVRLHKGELETSVLSALHSLLQLFLEPETSPCESCCQEGKLRRRLVQLRTEEDKCKAEQVILFEQFADGRMDRQGYLAGKQDSTSRIGKLAEDMEKLRIQLQESGQGPVIPAVKDLGRYAFAKIPTREMLVEMVQSIRVYPDNTIEIVWKFKDEYTSVSSFYV